MIFKRDNKKKKRYLKAFLIIFSMFFIHGSFIAAFYNNFEFEGVIILVNAYFRFILFLFFAISIKKVLKELNYYKFGNKNFNHNYWTIAILLLIIFNGIFPITVDRKSGNLLLLMLFFATIIGFTLNKSLNIFINQIQLKYYKSLFIGLRILLVIVKFNSFLWNLMLQIIMSFRKKMNFIIFNFKKTKFIQKITYYNGDYLLNFK